MDSVKKQASEHVEPKITNIAEKLKSGATPNTTPRAMSMHKDVMPSIGSKEAREPGFKDVMPSIGSTKAREPGHKDVMPKKSGPSARSPK